MLRVRSTFIPALTGCLCWSLLAPHSLPGAEGKRLGVTGTGRIEVRPDIMELSATVTGGAELTVDALKKFRNNRRRGVEAINKLKIAGLEVKGGGVSVISNAAVQQFQNRFGGNQQQTAPGQTTFSETLTILVSGIDHLEDDKVQDVASKILDAAKDAGLTMGQALDNMQPYYNYNSFRPQIVNFRLGKVEEARLKALDEAAHDARKKAEQMAKRLNLKIGEPVSARDASPRQTTISQPNYGGSQPLAADSSTSLHNIAVEALLTVEYEIR